MGRINTMPDYLKNIIHTQIFSILNIIVGFVSLFLLIKYLHVEEYGEYVLIQGFLAFVGLVISQNIYSYARLKIPGAEQTIQYGYLKTVIVLVAIFYVLCFLLIWIFDLQGFFWDFFEIDISLSLIVLVMLAFELLNAEIMRFLIALKNIHIKNYAQFFQKIFIFISIIILLINDSFTLKNFLYLFIFGQLVVFLYLVKNIKIKELFLSPFMKDVVLKGYQIALPLIPIGLMSLALNYTDTLMIAKMIDKESVAQYGFASQIVSIAMMLIGTSIVLTLFPYATEAYNKNNIQEKNNFFIKMYIYSIFLAILFYILVTLNATWFINFLNLEKYKDIPFILSVLAIFPLLQSIYNVSAHHLQLHKVIGIQLYISIFIMLLNVILNYFLISWYGVIGAAYASLLSYVFLGVIYFSIILKKDLILKEYINSHILKIIAYLGTIFLLSLLLFIIDKKNLIFIFFGNIFLFVSLILLFKKFIKKDI